VKVLMFKSLIETNFVGKIKFHNYLYALEIILSVLAPNCLAKKLLNLKFSKKKKQNKDLKENPFLRKLKIFNFQQMFIVALILKIEKSIAKS
jgi:hypothetical protein